MNYRKLESPVGASTNGVSMKKPEKFVNQVYIEKPFYHADEMDDFIKYLENKLKDCKHPGCCCVCGHEGKCPEDGPSVIDIGMEG